MTSKFLRNLGVEETIIKALQMSSCEEGDFEILKDKEDTKLLLKINGDEAPSQITLSGFVPKNESCPSKTQTDSSKTEPNTDLPYNCEDSFEFLTESDPLKPNLKINGISVRLTESHLKLLRYLAQKLVDTKTGWVYIQDLNTNKVIPSDGYQLFSRLRSIMSEHLLKKNGKDLIQASRRAKQYRLSVDPKNIKFSKAETQL